MSAMPPAATLSLRARWTGIVAGLCWMLMAGIALVAAVWQRETMRGDWPAIALVIALMTWAIASVLLWARARHRSTRAATFSWAAMQLVAVVLLIVLGVGEGVARWIERDRLLWEQVVPEYRTIMEKGYRHIAFPHEGGLLRKNLRLDVKGAYYGESFPYRTNALGLVGEAQIDLPKPKGTFRIVLLGDSFVAGYRVDQRVNLESQLKRALERELDGDPLKNGFDRWEVWSVVTQDPVTAWYYLQEHGHALQADLFVLNLCLINDPLQAGLNLSPSVEGPSETYYRIKIDGLLEAAPNERHHAIHLALAKWTSAPAHPFPRVAFDFDKPRPKMHRRAGEPEMTSAWALGRMSLAFIARLAGSASAGFSSAPTHLDSSLHWGQLGLFLKDPPPEIVWCFDALDRCLSEIGNWSAREEIPVVVTLIPIRYQVIPQDYAATFAYPYLRRDAFDLELPNRRVAEMCERAGLPLLDFTPHFAALGDDAGSHFLPNNDLHWNGAGYEFAAEFLATRLKAMLEDGQQG